MSYILLIIYGLIIHTISYTERQLVRRCHYQGLFVPTPGVSTCETSNDSYCYEKYTVYLDGIGVVRGCVNNEEAQVYCRKTIMGKDSNEIMRIFCCRSSDFCNMDLIKSNVTDWNETEYITDTINIINGSLTTMYQIYPKYGFIRENFNHGLLVICLVVVLGIAFSILFIYIFFLEAQNKSFSSASRKLNNDKNSLKTIDDRLWKLSSGVFQQITRKNIEVGAYKVFTGIYDNSEVVLHAYPNAKLKNFRREFGVYFIGKLYHNDVSNSITFGYLKDSYSYQLFQGCTYLSVFDYKNCATVGEFLENFANISNEEILKQTVSALVSLSQGLKYLHSSHYMGESKSQIYHRCLYTDSFYVCFNNRTISCKLTNFQYSSVLYNNKLTSVFHNKGSNPIEGCPSFIFYAAPEVLRDNKESVDEDDLLSDVYSLGCIFWKLYCVAFEVSNRKSKNQISKEVLLNHPFQNNYKTDIGLTREKMYERLLDDKRLSKKVPGDSNLHFPLLDFIVEIAVKCMKFESQNRCDAETIAYMVDKLEDDVNRALCSQES